LGDFNQRRPNPTIIREKSDERGGEYLGDFDSPRNLGVGATEREIVGGAHGRERKRGEKWREEEEEGARLIHYASKGDSFIGAL
jgi:hypothetical protein